MFNEYYYYEGEANNIYATLYLGRNMHSIHSTYGKCPALIRISRVQ